tara:strand:+ start:234 stop:500 length:267 start_codon:yes stop_codon:yes gene_type:complete
MKHYKDSNNKIFAYESDGSQDHIISKDLIPITEKEAKEIIDARYVLTYKEKREAEYPSIQDQLDKIYHSGVTGWKADIKKIKDKYPKE